MDSKKYKPKNWITIMLMIFFVINCLKFINIEGNEKPLPSTLFNMVFSSALLILELTRKKISFNETLDKYFGFK